jgi:hypothetical protein
MRKLGDICVLAVQTAEVAAYSGYGVGQAAGKEMKEWLLFNGILIGSNEVSIDQRH